MSEKWTTRDASLRKDKTLESTRMSTRPSAGNEPKQTVISIYSPSFICGLNILKY